LDALAKNRIVKKKYCECYQKGSGCGPLCKCLDCKNVKKEGAVELNSKTSTRTSSFSSKNFSSPYNSINDSNMKNMFKMIPSFDNESNKPFENVIEKENINKEKVAPCMIIINNYIINTKFISEEETLSNNISQDSNSSIIFD